MNKNIVFGISWFEKHQGKLLWLLNTPIIKIWFRWVMRIKKSDLSINENVDKILPNNFSYGKKIVLVDHVIYKDGHKEIFDKTKKTHLKLKKIKAFAVEQKTDFRTSDKYSKRLYHAFKPLWYLFHVIDWVAFDRYEYLSNLSFGFSTLTIYPDSTNPGTTSMNGNVGIFPNAGTSFTDTRNATTGTENSIGVNSAPIGEYYQSWQPRWAFRRGFFLFDTSALGASVTISSWIMSIYGESKTSDINDSNSFFVIVPVNPASNTVISNSDFNKVTFTAKSNTITVSSFAISGYNNFTGNDNTIISKTNITKLGCIGGHDLNSASWTNNPGYSDAYVSLSNTAGTSQDPKLVITYMLPILSNFFQLF